MKIAERLKIERQGNYIVVVLDGGADYLAEYNCAMLGDQVANQLAAVYREAYIDGWTAKKDEPPPEFTPEPSWNQPDAFTD